MISFHSLEDRIVKTFIARESRSEVDRRAPFAEPRAEPAAARWRACKPATTEVARQPARALGGDARRRAHRRAVRRGRAESAGGRGYARAARGAGRSRMTRLNVLLLIALLASSLYLVRVSYDARRLFADLDRAQAEERALDSEHERLKAELQAQATPLRVEKTAREQAGDAHRDAGGDAVRRLRARRLGAGRKAAVSRPAMSRPKAARPQRGAQSVRSVSYSTSPLLASKTPPWRSKFLVALVGLGFCVLLGRAVYVQIVGTPFFLRRARSATAARSICPPAAAASSTATA